MFQIFVDSAANLPAVTAKQYDINVISFVNLVDGKEIICFGHPGASLIIADGADGDTKLLRKLQLRQPGGLPCLADDTGRFGVAAGGHKESPQF